MLKEIPTIGQGPVGLENRLAPGGPVQQAGDEEGLEEGPARCTPS